MLLQSVQQKTRIESSCLPEESARRFLKGLDKVQAMQVRLVAIVLVDGIELCVRVREV
jgi:hypothetical protein